MIVLQPIADAAHMSTDLSRVAATRGGQRHTSSKGELHKWGFTTDMTELDIVYGSEEKLYRANHQDKRNRTSKGHIRSCNLRERPDR